MSERRKSSVYAPHAPPRRSIANSNINQHRRSRTQSAVRDNVLDVRRHVTNVAQNSQALTEKFMDQLKQYKTFAPLFATQGVYAPPSFGGTVSSSPMRTLDQILESRTSFLVRNTSHHRITSDLSEGSPLGGPSRIPAADFRQRMAALESDVASLSRGGDLASPHKSHDTGDESKFSVWEQQSDYSVDQTEDSAFVIWQHEHPNATQEEVRAEVRRRQIERVEAERANRSKYLRRWHAELEMLMAEEASAERHKVEMQQERLFEAAQAVIPPRPPQGRMCSEYEVETQKLSWEVFNKGVGSFEQPSAATAAPVKASRRAGYQIISGNKVEAEALKEWVAEKWPSHTHRHEAAALRIQCAFRSYRSKCVVHRVRYLRAQEHNERIKAEEELMFAWKVAVQVMNEQHHQPAEDGSVEHTLRSINFFVQNINAKVLHRRAAKQKFESSQSELHVYAAIKIQAVYRGHRGRQIVNELRHPEIGERRKFEAQTSAVTVIAKHWRGYLARKRLKKKQKCVVILQCAFRRFSASLCLAAKRREARQKDMWHVTAYAATRIMNFIRKAILKRRKMYEEMLPKLTILHAVGFGLKARREVAAMYLAKKHKAATKIQSLYRMDAAKQRVQKMREVELVEAEREAKYQAAVILQRNLCSWVRKIKVWRRKAAIKIQKVARGMFGRREARNVSHQIKSRVTDQQRDDAAALIQALYRGFRDRCIVTTKRDALHIIQTRVRSTLAKKTIRQRHAVKHNDQQEAYRNDAALILQDFYFVFIRMKLLRKFINTAASRISRFVKRVPSYKEVQRRKAARDASLNATATADDQDNKARTDSGKEATYRETAACSIQSAVRVRQAKQATTTLKEERRKVHHELQVDEAAVMIQCFMRHVVTRKKILRKKLSGTSTAATTLRVQEE